MNEMACAIACRLGALKAIRPVLVCWLMHALMRYIDIPTRICNTIALVSLLSLPLHVMTSCMRERIHVRTHGKSHKCTNICIPACA